MSKPTQVNIPKEAFNSVYLPLLTDDTHRYLVLYGGAGSGKSVFAVQRYLVRLMQKPLCNLMVIRAVADTHRDSTYALFKQMIQSWGLQSLFQCTDSTLRIRCKNGNSVIFKGLDDREKLKSVTFASGELTDVWVEEASEIEEADFNQLDVRLRGGTSKKQITVTFNPISALHWLKKRFFDAPSQRAVVLKTTYRDNKFLDEEYKETLESFKESDPYYYAVYCLGEWGVLGSTVFSALNVTERLSQLPPPVLTGEFTYETYFDPVRNQVMIDNSTIKLLESDTGYIKFYALPTPSTPYVIGGDTAGEGSDFFVGQVIDNVTGQQVCTLRAQLDEDLYARQMYCLGIYYNTALLSIEANFSTAPILELEHLAYPKLYVREAVDTYTHKPRQSFGFKTTATTRPLLISELVSIVRDHPQYLNDRTTLEEMLTFVRNEKGRPEAEQGAHDDCVMALGIAYFTRDQQRATAPAAKSHWTDSMKEDYQNASPAERDQLLKLWGNPN